MKNIIKILFVIIGTIVGAGFASGKEIYLFFFVYGLKGIVGIIISSLIMSITIYKVFKICSENKIINYQDFCKYIGNEYIGNIVHIFLIITFFIMISGFSSFLKQEFNINQSTGSILIILLCYITLRNNVKGVVKVSNYLMPLLIIFLVITSLKNLDVINNYNNIFNYQLTPKYGGYFQSILYGCYNCILLIPVVISLNNYIKNKKDILYSTIGSGFIILMLSICVYNLLLLGDIRIYNVEMPIIEIVKKYGSIYKNLYIIIIGIAIYTTAVSTGYSFLNRWENNKKVYKRYLKVISVFAFFLSKISFSFLVNLLYPILGIVGVLEILLIMLSNTNNIKVLKYCNKKSIK